VAVKAQYSLLLAAYTASKKVAIQGQGECFGNFEKIRNVYFVIE
jgi:hypothetical protein